MEKSPFNEPIFDSNQLPETVPCGPAWHIHLLGTLTISSRQTNQQITHFPTRMTGSLLAYLAYCRRPMPRDVVIEAIWPGVSSKSGRNRLSLALSFLRTLLATPDVPAISVFVGDTLNISLNPILFSTDVADFERAVKRAERAMHQTARLSAFSDATATYTGDLLIGRYEPWVEVEQDRLRQRYDAAEKERERLLKAIHLATSQTNAKNRGVFAPVSPAIPYSPTRFFGREGEITRLVSLLTTSVILESPDASILTSVGNLFFDAPSAPLVTLTGMGGIGKSRLATETARRVHVAFHGRVWFVELAEITDPQQIWSQLRDALGLVKESQEDEADQVLGRLATAPALLVMDNMEQFVSNGQAVEFVNTLRKRLPNVAILITSRHIVGAYGEQIFPLGSLLAPAEWTGIKPSVKDAAICLDMFADRARAVRPSFSLSQTDMGVALRICQSLDGIPLAIELAAARLDFLTPAQLLKQVEQRFTFLKSRRKDVPARHRSLYAAIETSYQLLPLDLQQLYRALSVFRGGWTIEAAVAVSDLDEDNLWDALVELGERSMIQSARSEADVRFRMLDTLRDFAADRLLECKNEERTEVRNKYRRYFSQLAAEAEPHLAQGQISQRTWLDKLEADNDNLRSVLDEPVSWQVALSMATQLHRFWLLRGYAVEGRKRLAHCFTNAVAVSNSEQAKVNNALGVLAWASGALSEAHASFDIALNLYEDEGNLPTLAGVLNNIAIVASQNGIFDTARDSYNRSLNLYRILNDSLRQSIVLSNLGTILMYQNEHEAATNVLEEVLEIQRNLGDSLLIRATLQNIAEVAVGQRNTKRAVTAMQESLSLRREIGERSTFWNTLETVVSVLYLGKRYEEALVVCTAASTDRAQSKASIMPIDLQHETEMMRNLRDVLSANAICSAENIGKNMDFLQAIDFAQAALSKVKSKPSV